MGNVYSNDFGQSPFDLILGRTLKTSDIMFNKVISSAQAGDVSGLVKQFSSLASSLGGDDSASEVLAIAGESLGRFLSFVKKGERDPSNVLANNPGLTPPKMTSKMGFGEMMNYMVAMDQVLKRKIATFSSAVGGSGSMFNLIGSAGGGFQGLTDVAGVVQQMVSGGIDVTGSKFLENAMQEAVGNVASMLNVQLTSLVDLTKADNAIPIVLAVSAQLAGRDKSPFSIDTIAQGWQMNKAITEFFEDAV